MKPRVTYPRTVVLPKDCEELWLAVKENNPTQSFNGWITRAVRDYYGTREMPDRFYRGIADESGRRKIR